MRGIVYSDRAVRLFQQGILSIATCHGLVGLCCIVASEFPLRNMTEDKIGMVTTVLRLTNPSEYVMDSKGETIYRNRPFYYVLEELTGMRLKEGLIKDTITEDFDRPPDPSCDGLSDAIKGCCIYSDELPSNRLSLVCSR